MKNPAASSEVSSSGFDLFSAPQGARNETRKIFKGHGYGADLLIDALRRIALAAEQVGLSIVILDVLDCGDPEKTSRRKDLYQSYGFIALEEYPMRMYLPIGTIRKLLADK